MGSQPLRSLPLKMGSALLQDSGAARLSVGAGLPASAIVSVPRVCFPISLPPRASSSQVVFGPFSGDTSSIKCEPFC